MNLLSKDFFLRDPLVVARELLGKILSRKLNGKIISGRIIEVEAYLPLDDEASHGFKGLTKRNQSLFKEGGHAYVHQIHMQNCLDIVVEKANVPAGILVRALEPLHGIDFMMVFRNKENVKQLTSGPGKLTKALNITKSHDGLDITNPDSEINIFDDGYTNFEIVETKRVGITKSIYFDYRFYIEGNPYISKK